MQSALNNNKARVTDNTEDERGIVKKGKAILKKYEGFEEAKCQIRKLNYGDDYKTPDELRELKLNKLKNI